ncbi:DUF4328 domain-containing protein [Sphingomonas sp. KR3-1]|uniref:DUF4328 domain-containing protein n=1 Tax=Sphingomonas sp. KR3-1 TaxID=3156611 RepID=UPI0032B59068
MTWVVTIMVVIDALNMPFVAVTVQFFPSFFATSLMPIADQFDTSMWMLKIATIILFSVWIYRAGSNLLRVGYQDLEFTPGARIWWFAVPIANLFKPFQGMRELWNASHGETEYTITPPLVSTWWAFWLAANILASANARFPSVALIDLTALADIGLAALAIPMIHQIARAQARMVPEEVAEVFA